MTVLSQNGQKHQLSPLKRDNQTNTTVFSVNPLPGYCWLQMGIIKNVIKLKMGCPPSPCTEGEFPAVMSRAVTRSLVLSTCCHHTAPMETYTGVETHTPRQAFRVLPPIWTV